jgi:hypothetical protein
LLRCPTVDLHTPLLFFL